MNSSNPTIRQATIDDLSQLVPLFDAYRRFYRQPGDLEGARLFLQERIDKEQSTIFIALDGESALGFTQLFPSFSSGAMESIFILNDLFVDPEARGKGVGTALLDRAAEHGREVGAVRLTLSTELSNQAAQSVYEKNGWKRDTVFCVYNQSLT